MFVVRTLCLEASFFSSYRKDNNNVDPLIPEEYRLVIYLLPALLSFIINLTKLAWSMKLKDFQYFKKFPQFILCPMFSPLMFEGNTNKKDDNEPPVRVWKLGSIFNSVFIGCLPQILLIAMEQYREVPTWYLKALSDYNYHDSNALIRYPYGNTVFSIVSFLLYLFLTTIFFSWERMFNENGLLCKFCKTRCIPCPNLCNKPQSEESDPSIVNCENDPEQGLELTHRNPQTDGRVHDIEEEKTRAEVTIHCNYSIENLD